MFLDQDFRAAGEPRPENPPEKIQYSKGYPSRRDPQAENPKGIMHSSLGEASLRRLRQHYS